MKNGWLRVLEKTDTEQEVEKFLQKDLEIKKCFVPLQPRSKNGFSQENKRSSLKRLITVQEASTEKYNLSRSVNSFIGIIVSGQAKDIILYNEEFDPGSG